MTVSKNAQLCYLHGNARLGRGDGAGADGEYSAALRIDPDYADAYCNRGRARLALGNLPGASADCDRLLQLRPDWAPAYCLRGDTRRALGDLPGALADYDAAVRLDPGSAEAGKKRGCARLELGDAVGASADFDTALRINPQDAQAYRQRSTARLMLGDTAGAEEDARQALALGPCAESHAQCGAVCQSTKDFAGAVAEYSRAIESNPRLFWAYLMRGNAYYHLATLGETYADYRRAFQLDAHLAASHLVKIVLREVRTNPAAALAACDEHLRRHPEDFLTCGRRGVILLLLGRNAEAQADLEAFRRRSPHDVEWLDAVIDAVLRRRQDPPREGPTTARAAAAPVSS
jgi:tetratricopeptide (TPR) repeat protein